jgi:hypothetical protein
MSETLQAQIPIGTAATKVVAAVPHGQQIMIKNQAASTQPFFCGGSNVTTANGYEVKAGEELAKGPFELPPETEIYAVAASSGSVAHVFTIVGD